MDLNTIIFPAPKCSYTSESRNLIWVDSHPSNTPTYHHLQRDKMKQQSQNKENNQVRQFQLFASCMGEDHEEADDENGEELIRCNTSHNSKKMESLRVEKVQCNTNQGLSNTERQFGNSNYQQPQGRGSHSHSQSITLLSNSKHTNTFHSEQNPHVSLQNKQQQQQQHHHNHHHHKNHHSHDKLKSINSSNQLLHSPIRVTEEKQLFNNSPLKRASELGPQLSKIAATKVPCIFLPCTEHSDKLLIYFHGNAEDVGGSYEFISTLRKHLKLNILAVEYPGYGLYQSSPSSDQILADADSVYEYVRSQLRVSPQNIILFGRSIGSGPACYLAGTRSIGGLILMSPYTSIRNVAKHIAGTLIQYLVAERFRNIDCLKTANAPTLFIHGKMDSLIPYDHSLQLMEVMKEKTLIYLSPDMTHNDFHMTLDILHPIQQFFQQSKITVNPIPIQIPYYLRQKQFA